MAIIKYSSQIEKDYFIYYVTFFFGDSFLLAFLLLSFNFLQEVNFLFAAIDGVFMYIKIVRINSACRWILAMCGFLNQKGVQIKFI